MKKPLETDWVGPQIVWGKIPWNHQGGVNSDNQVDGDSDMVLTYWLGVGGATQKRNTGLCQHFCQDKSCPSSSCLDVGHFSFSPYFLVPFKRLPQHGNLASESK